MTAADSNPPTFQELILRLQTFWAERGCVLQQPYDVEVGAGTMAPETFLRVLGRQPYKVAYVQPSRRPADGRYGENPNRLFKHTQLQVILKPPPDNVQDLYLATMRRYATLYELWSWANALNNGQYTRDQVSTIFLSSLEFQLRVNRVAQEGCLR